MAKSYKQSDYNIWVITNEVFSKSQILIQTRSNEKKDGLLWGGNGSGASSVQVLKFKVLRKVLELKLLL